MISRIYYHFNIGAEKQPLNKLLGWLLHLMRCKCIHIGCLASCRVGLNDVSATGDHMCLIVFIYLGRLVNSNNAFVVKRGMLRQATAVIQSCSCYFLHSNQSIRNQLLPR